RQRWSPMYIGQTRFWLDNHGGSIGVRSSNMQTGSQPFECYLKKYWDLPAIQIYETDNDGIGSEFRLSFCFLWFSLNMLLWASDNDPKIKPGDDRYAMNYRRWGWHWMDRRSLWLAWNWWHYCFDLPWLTSRHVRTELMDLFGTRVICDRDDIRFRTPKGSEIIPDGWEQWCAIKKSVTRSFPYKYVTKRGVSQYVTASCVIMQTWRCRKW